MTNRTIKLVKKALTPHPPSLGQGNPYPPPLHMYGHRGSPVYILIIPQCPEITATTQDQLAYINTSQTPFYTNATTTIQPWHPPFCVTHKAHHHIYFFINAASHDQWFATHYTLYQREPQHGQFKIKNPQHCDLSNPRMTPPPSPLWDSKPKFLTI